MTLKLRCVLYIRLALLPQRSRLNIVDLLATDIFITFITQIKVILYSYLILKKMNERITDS